MARKRLETFADEANAGRVHYDARELKRKIWAAFAEFDATEKEAERRRAFDTLPDDYEAPH